MAFAVPAVVLALLAHLPFAGRLPPVTWLLEVATAAVVLAAAGGGLRAVLVIRRGDPAPSWGVGGPRSFAGLLATQGLLHGALAVHTTGPGARQATGGHDGAHLDALINALLCHNRPATLPGDLDPALVAAARRAIARTSPGAGPGSSGGAHTQHGGFAAMLTSGSASTAALAIAMPLAHAAAAALTLWWARRGASLLVGALRLLAARGRRRPVRPPVLVLAPPARPPCHEPPDALPRLAMLRHAVARRGPPGATRATADHQAAAWQLAAA
ncbi:hypothetical protein [Frankia sp. AgKG'84/4]